MPDRPGSGDAIRFKRISAADLPLLSGWMQRPHWREWWGDPQTELGLIRDMIEGRDSTEPYLFFLDDIAAGYIQMWKVADAQCEPWLTQSPWLADLPQGCVGVDVSLASESQLSQGIGSTVLRAFTEILYQRGFDDIIIDPDAANTRAVRAYEKAGFCPVRTVQDRSGETLIMRHEKDQTE
jgi:aminoglycoside 6'-N-acetyltransferase